MLGRTVSIQVWTRDHEEYSSGGTKKRGLKNTFLFWALGKVMAPQIKLVAGHRFSF